LTGYARRDTLFLKRDREWLSGRVLRLILMKFWV
jgi:hypothetical protein